MTRAAELDQRVTVYSRAVTKVAGEQTETFSSQGVFWALVTPVRANERQSGGIDVYTDAYRFRFRRTDTTSAITPDYQLVWGSRTYEVKTGPNPSDEVWADVLAEVQVPSAA